MRIFRHPSSILTTVPMVLFLAACGGGDPAPAGETGAAQSAAPAAAASTILSEVTTEMRPLTGYRAEGHVTITRDGTNYVVAVDAESHLPQADYPMHIHEGRCAEGGRVAAALADVQGQEAGEGRASTRIEATALSPTVNYFVQMHAPDGTPIACGDLPLVTL